MEVDWRKSTEEDRRLLFSAVEALCWKLDIDIYEMMNRVYGEPYAISSHFIGNFRRGRTKKYYAQKIMEWLREEHPTVADEVEKGCAKLRAAKSKPKKKPVRGNSYHLSPFDNLVRIGNQYMRLEKGKQDYFAHKLIRDNMQKRNLQFEHLMPNGGLSRSVLLGCSSHKRKTRKSLEDLMSGVIVTIDLDKK